MAQSIVLCCSLFHQSTTRSDKRKRRKSSWHLDGLHHLCSRWVTLVLTSGLVTRNWLWLLSEIVPSLYILITSSRHFFSLSDFSRWSVLHRTFHIQRLPLPSHFINLIYVLIISNALTQNSRLISRGVQNIHLGLCHCIDVLSWQQAHIVSAATEDDTFRIYGKMNQNGRELCVVVWCHCSRGSSIFMAVAVPTALLKHWFSVHSPPVWHSGVSLCNPGCYGLGTKPSPRPCRTSCKHIRNPRMKDLVRENRRVR